MPLIVIWIDRDSTNLQMQIYRICFLGDVPKTGGKKEHRKNRAAINRHIETNNIYISLKRDQKKKKKTKRKQKKKTPKHLLTSNHTHINRD